MSLALFSFGLTIEMFILYFFTFNILDELRFGKKISAFCFFLIHGLNAVKSILMMDYMFFKAITSWIVIIFVMHILFKDKWYKKIMIYAVYMLCIIAAESIAMLMAKYIYSCNIRDLSAESIGTYLWQITTYVLIFIFTMIASILIKHKKINYESEVSRYIYLYISVQSLPAIMFTISILEFEAISHVILSAVIFVILASTGIGILIFTAMKNSERKLAEIKLLEMDARLKDRHFLELKEQYMEYKKIRHDFYNHVKIINELSDSTKIKEYTDSIKEKFDEMDKVSYCDNLTMDALLSIKNTDAIKRGVNISFNVCSLNDIGISDFDLCTVVSNLLDNAIEAASKTKSKNVFLKISRKLGRLVILLENTSLPVGPGLKTTKDDKENHGIGIKSIKNTVKKYDGDTFFNYDNDKFTSIINMSIDS